MMDRVWKKGVHGITRGTWSRLGSMLVLATCYGMAETLLLLVVGWQVVTLAMGGRADTGHVRTLGGELSGYIYQIFLYLTCNSNQRPFPFSPWLRHPPPPA